MEKGKVYVQPFLDKVGKGYNPCQLFITVCSPSRYIFPIYMSLWLGMGWIQTQSEFDFPQTCAKLSHDCIPANPMSWGSEIFP